MNAGASALSRAGFRRAVSNPWYPWYNNKVDRCSRHRFSGRKLFACLLLSFCCPAVAQIPADNLQKLVHGSIVTTEGEPVGDARVEIRDLRGVEIGSGVTDSAGGFEIITAADSGEYLVLAAKAFEVEAQWISLDKPDLAVKIALPAATQRFAPTLSHATVSATQLHVPAKAWTHLQSAHKEFSKMDLAGAAREVERAFEVDPACAPAFSMRAFLELATKNPQGAVEDAEQATRLDPHDAESFVALAMAENSLQQFQNAAEAARHALALRADSWQGRLELAKSFYGQDQLILALRELDELGKDFPDVHLVRGHVLLDLGRSQDAVEEFDLFLEQEPSDPRSESIRRMVAKVRPIPAPDGSAPR
jgi:hypothetical protein